MIDNVRVAFGKLDTVTLSSLIMVERIVARNFDKKRFEDLGHGSMLSFIQKEKALCDLLTLQLQPDVANDNQHDDDRYDGVKEGTSIVIV